VTRAANPHDDLAQFTKRILVIAITFHDCAVEILHELWREQRVPLGARGRKSSSASA
jgi:hypothetical protein